MISEITNNDPVQPLDTVEKLEEAVQIYKSSDLSGKELLSQWEAIRDASLTEIGSEQSQTDKVPGADSY